MKRLGASILTVLLMLATGGCRELPEYADAGSRDLYANFDALSDIISSRYCYLSEKQINWPDSCRKYRAMIDSKTTEADLFFILSDLLDGLEDGHVNLTAPFSTSYYKKWWSDYPQNYNARLVEEYYFNFNYRSTGGIDYGILPQNVGYMHYSSFSYGIGEGNLDAVLAFCASANGLIIDVRDNGGGSVSNVKTLVGRFISERLQAGTICHKNGPGHNDFSEPYPFYFDPAPAGRIMWGKPVVVLCNRSTFSAANNFVSVMKCLPGVTVVGATTGGGSGMPFSSELTNGWGIRFSASPLRDPQGHLTEFGVAPTEGCEVDLDPYAALEGRDTMLDFAVAKLQG